MHETTIKHKFALGDNIKSHEFLGGIEGKVLAVSVDLHGEIAYTVSVYDRAHHAFIRHMVLEAEIEDYVVVVKTQPVDFTNAEPIDPDKVPVDATKSAT